MVGLLQGDIDAAEAMTYNEYAQVLEAENPETGELYTPDDFNVVSYEEAGVGDAAGRASGPTPPSWRPTRRTATSPCASWPRRSRAGPSAATTPTPARSIVLAAGSQLGASHQLWQMNEINKLIWPAEGGIGIIDQAAWDRTVEIAQSTPNLEGDTVLTAAPRRARSRTTSSPRRSPCSAATSTPPVPTSPRSR